MRINGFEQIKGFYSWVFDNQDKNIRSVHISLYMFLVNQNNRNSWVEWFKCPFDLAMAGSGVTNKNTYYKTLTDLQNWNLIKYKKGVNNYKAPLISIEVLFDTATVPQSEPQLLPQSIPLPEPLLQPQMANNIKLLTNNLKLVTTNIDSVLDFLNSDDEKTKKSVNDIEVIDALTLDSFYPLEILKRHYLGNQEVVSAVLKIKENGFKDEKHLREKMDEFIEHLTGQYETIKTPKDFASHFRNWNKNPGRAKTEKKESPFTVNKLEKYS